MHKRTERSWKGRQAAATLLPILACLSLVACGIPNQNFEITIINPDPEAARLFLSGPDGEEEVLGAWSKAFFRETRLSLRTELIPDQRTVFLGWKRGYPLNGPDGTFTHADYAAEDVLVVDVNAYSYAVSPRVERIANKDPRWIAPDRIVFHSNRDGGEGIWMIDPSGGPAACLTMPTLDPDGSPAMDHRLEKYSILGAWQSSPLVHASRGTYPGPNPGPEVQTILDADSRDSWPITARMFGVENLYPSHKRYLSDAGDLVWFSRSGLDEEPRALFCVFRPGEGPILIQAVRSEGYQCATAATGRYAFILSNETVSGSYLPARLWILDSREGILAEAADLRGSHGSLKIIYHQPIALSGDGASLLLSLDARDGDGTLLGATLAIVGSGGTVTFLPSRYGFVEAVGSSFRFSADGSSLVGSSLSGVWGRYSASDGSLLEVLPGKPADLSPSWGAGFELFERGDRHAADGTEPGGTRSVESAASGRNRDLVLHDPGHPDIWLTGPESGDGL